MTPAPGIYPALPMAEYLAMHAVSASILQAMIEQCPQAAWFQSWLNPHPLVAAGGTPQRAGTICHSLVLEGGDMSKVEVIDPNDYPTKSSGNIPDGWTNKDIKAARDRAIFDGKTPVLKPQFAIITMMVESALTFIESLRDTEPAVWELFQPGGGDSEATMVWDEGGVLCRARPDRFSKNRRLMGDYKTTLRLAEPDSWGRTQLVGMGYYTAAAHYRRGARALTGETPDYVYLVQEQQPPFLCSLVGIEPKGYELGAHKNAYALELWRQCAKANRWPGYPPRVAYPEIPSWEAARWEGRAWSKSETETSVMPGGDPDEMERIYKQFDDLERAA
jgi:PDDEXK-like uncharacterized protein DUF3799